MVEKLNQAEMCSLKGGVTAEDYCGTLDMLIENNWGSWSDTEKDSAAAAYAKHC